MQALAWIAVALLPCAALASGEPWHQPARDDRAWLEREPQQKTVLGREASAFLSWVLDTSGGQR